jgi:hypothetical protein
VAVGSPYGGCTDYTDSRVLSGPGPIKNGGTGPSLNIKGLIYWRDSPGGGDALESVTLGAGEEALIISSSQSGSGPNFNNVRGFLRYLDALGVEWQTHFEFSGTVKLTVPPTLRLKVLAVNQTSVLGEPPYNSDAWANMPADEALWWRAH